jgi:hypothetical protein
MPVAAIDSPSVGTIVMKFDHFPRGKLKVERFPRFSNAETVSVPPGVPTLPVMLELKLSCGSFLER